MTAIIAEEFITKRLVPISSAKEKSRSRAGGSYDKMANVTGQAIPLTGNSKTCPTKS